MYRILGWIFRLTISVVFIFSGVVKGVDPWGTAIKIGEYASVLNIDIGQDMALVLSVLLCSAELLLGLLLLLGLYKRGVKNILLLLVSTFTIVTLCIAITDPVADCGCFGDAVKLSNWQTFWKNIVLLMMLLFLKIGADRSRVKPSNILMFTICVLMSIALPLYSVLNVPVVDFLPYKIGVDLLSDFDDTLGEDVKTTLIYRNRKSGEERKFTLEDTEWQNDTLWEFVDSVIEYSDGAESLGDVSLMEFAILDHSGDIVTDSLLLGQKVAVVVLWNSDKSPNSKCVECVESQIINAKELGYTPICITPNVGMGQFSVGAYSLSSYSMDAKTLKMFLRAKVGVVLLDNGVIESKYTSPYCLF